MMKSNITLIGMPGSGKSTVGIILAKKLQFGFIDTDILIQINRQKSLQEIINETGYLNLRQVEEEEILKLNVEKHVIATGGSAVYSEKAMQHLHSFSTMVFLETSFDEIQRRIHNFRTRGIAMADNQTFQELFDERQELYRKYAEMTIDCNNTTQDDVADIISAGLIK